VHYARGDEPPTTTEKRYIIQGKSKKTGNQLKFRFGKHLKNNLVRQGAATINLGRPEKTRPVQEGGHKRMRKPVQAKGSKDETASKSRKQKFPG